MFLKNIQLYLLCLLILEITAQQSAQTSDYTLNNLSSHSDQPDKKTYDTLSELPRFTVTLKLSNDMDVEAGARVKGIDLTNTEAAYNYEY